MVMEAFGGKFVRLWLVLRDVDLRDKLLIVAMVMQAVTLYFAWAAVDQAESARYAAYDALEQSRGTSQSCSFAASRLDAVKDAADDAASLCRSR